MHTQKIVKYVLSVALIAVLPCVFAAEAGEKVVKVSPEGEIRSIESALDKVRALREAGEIKPGERMVVELAISLPLGPSTSTKPSITPI